MRNVLLFIRRYHTFFLFLLLQILSWWFLASFNRFHEARLLTQAQEITGAINSRYDRVEDFFQLRAENQRVHRLNDSLLNLMPKNNLLVDTQRVVREEVAGDSIRRIRRYVYRAATVIYNTVNEEKNYFQIDRGSDQGIRENMAVLNGDGSAVGVIVLVSPNFAQAMSLLHVQQRVNASLKKTGDFGTLEWDGDHPDRLLLKGIPKSVFVKLGDTILTSSYSFNFPPGKMLGKVSSLTTDKRTNFHIIEVQPAANFRNLQQVFVVENLQMNEQVQLNQDARKRIEDPKNRRP
ncbi:MAG: rod shape-determining protein MreC [Bacteroidetes bacterium]|nr:rod shape-determining protein MreC [Bacteroidota bacterium]